MPLKKKLKSKKEDEDEGIYDEKELKEQQDEEDDDGDEDASEGSDDDDDGDDDEDEEDQDEAGGEMLMIDFEAREPAGSDLDSIRMMLKQKFLDTSVSIDELSRIIVEQGETLGNVVFQAVDEEDEEPMPTPSSSAAATSSDEGDIFGVLSGVDLTSPRTKSFTTGFLKFLSKREELNDVLKSKRVFYVVNERFINMPVKISIPMFQDLMKSLEKEKLEFDYWLFVARVYQKSAESSTGKPERMYVNPEEEIFEEFSECKTEIAQTTSGSSNAGGMRSLFSIFLVPTLKINEALNKVISLSE